MVKIDSIVELNSFRFGLGAFCVEQGGKERWGIMDTGGNIVVEPRWGMARPLGPEIVLLGKRENLNRCFDIVKQTFLPNKNKNVCDYNKYGSRVITRKGKNMKYGLEDREGHVLIPHKYKALDFISNNLLLAVDFKRKRGVLTVDGKELLPVQYDDICMRDETSSFVRIAKDRFVIDDSGQRPLKGNYIHLCECNTKGYCIFEAEGSPGVWKNRYVTQIDSEVGKFGLIDKDENILIPATYNFFEWLGDDRLLCMRHGMYGVIDCQGNEIVPCVYPLPMEKGIDRTYRAYPSRKIAGVVDEHGRIVLPFRY